MSTNNVDSDGEAKNEKVEQKPDKELVFDSHEIGKKEKTDYFVRVEGAEERKKEVIRRMQQQKDELIREQKAKEAAEKKDRQKINVSTKRKAFVDKINAVFWKGKRKFIILGTVIIVLFVVFCGPIIWKNVIQPRIEIAQYEKQTEERLKNSASAKEGARESRDILTEGDYTQESYDKALDNMDSKISEAENSDKKLYLVIEYGKLIMEVENNADKACEEMLKYEEEFRANSSSEAKVDYYSVMGSFYEEKSEESDYYREKSLEFSSGKDVIIKIEDNGNGTDMSGGNK